MVKAQKLEGILFKSIINSVVLCAYSVVLCVTAKITYKKIVFSSFATEIHKDYTEIHGALISLVRPALSSLFKWSRRKNLKEFYSSQLSTLWCSVPTPWCSVLQPKSLIRKLYFQVLPQRFTKTTQRFTEG